MKRFWLIAALMISGCTKPVEQWESTASVDLTKIIGLEDCMYQKVFTGSINLHVIRCPNSTVSTNYQSGKAPMNIITIDGVEYIPAVD